VREGLGQNIGFEHISLEQGLSQSSVYCILQDSQGFMWFGTADGLNRYDGYSFVVYRHDPGDPHSLSNNTVLALYEDREGVLWVGTNGGGLEKFDRATGRFEQYRSNPKDPHTLSGDTILSLYEDRSGVLWIGTSVGLDQFDRERKTITRFQPGIKYGAAWATWEDEMGLLWIGTSGGLLEYDREKVKVTQSLSGHVVRSVLPAREGVLWLGTDGDGLVRYDYENETSVHYQNHSLVPHTLSDNSISAMYKDPSGDLWIGTRSGGLDCFDREKETFTHLRKNPGDWKSLSSNRVQSVYQDREGVLWVGTYDAGINKSDVEKIGFAHYKSDPEDKKGSLNDNFIRAIFQDREGILWAGTPSGLNRIDRESGSVTHYGHVPGKENSLIDDSVRVIYQDRRGALWIGTAAGLDKLDLETWSFTHYIHDPKNSASLSGNLIRTIYEDPTGTLWIGTDRGLNKFDRRTGKFTCYEHQPGDPNTLSGNSISAILADQSGALWVGTTSGLNRFDGETGQFTHFQHRDGDQDSLSRNHVLSIHQDRRGDLWIGTFQGGLNKLVSSAGQGFDAKTVRFAHYREKDGLPNDVVYAILEDSRGNLWLSTNQGLSKFDPRRETFTNYDVGDGLQSNEFNWGAYHKSSRGEMFFGGVNGFNAFYPNRIQNNPCIPPVVLTSLTQGGENIAGQAVESIQEVTLRWPNNFFEFEFAALSFTQPAKNQYAYLLQGFDKGWNDIGTKRFGRYTNLPGGTYTLRVKASNNSDVWNEGATAIKITVVPPLWETGWFRGLVALLLIGGVIGGYRLRVRRIEAQRRELERQVRERTSQLQALFRAEEEMHHHLCLDQVLQALVDVAVDLLHADKSAVFVWAGDPDQDRKTLVMQVARGFGSEVRADLSSAWGEGLADQSVIAEDVTSALQPSQAEPQGEGIPIQVLQTMAAAGVRSFMHLPVKVNDRPFGIFNVSFSTPHAFSQEEARLFLALAQRASLAIENAQLYEQAQELAVLEERQRLARDLHDAVTQTLFSTSLIAEVLPRLWERDPDDGRRRLEQVRQATRSALAEMRTLLLELRPTGLAEADLDDLLHQLAETTRGKARVSVEVDARGECTLPRDVHVTFYRIAQEALNNVARHARANRVWVRLRCQPGGTTLSISDNGRGFDGACVPPGHLGIGIMRERAEAIGAQLEIESQAGQGTRVTVIWTKDE
jgi:ligand-binding sensor domain-containing protein/signal transduction histidine kinase